MSRRLLEPPVDADAGTQSGQRRLAAVAQPKECHGWIRSERLPRLCAVIRESMSCILGLHSQIAGPLSDHPRAP